jgi:hypothetical protein
MIRTSTHNRGRLHYRVPVSPNQGDPEIEWCSYLDERQQL